MQCALSGQYPTNPVVSKSTGKVYEKSLITKYIQQNNKCPITGQDITLDDLVEIDLATSVAKPRPPTLTSLPSLLSVFQSEWDSTMLEIYSLKQQYQQVRQELSRALYQNDSATRVIARLIKERDEAIQSLKDIKSHFGTSQVESHNGKSNGQTNESEVQGEESFDDKVKDKLTEINASLSKSRKKRKNPEGLQSSENISNFAEVDSIGSLHSSTDKGITSLSVNGSLIATGGNDSNIIIHNVAEGTIVSELNGHSKPITSLTWDGINNNLFSTSSDHSSILWKPSEDNTSWSLAHRFPTHKASVTSISLHPCRDYVVTGSMDATWNFNSLTSKNPLVSATNPDGAGYTCGSFHPDGLLLGLGTTNSIIQIWDVKSRDNVANFSDHYQQVSSLAFSENGFYLASTSQNNIVKLWDLRKLKCFHEIEIPNTEKVSSVAWDQSGSYLAVGGSVVQIFQTKKWDTPLVTLEQPASRIAFSDLAQKLYTVSDSDRSLRSFSAPETEN